MAVKRKRRPQRKRIGKVSYYFHHGAWWVYYLDGERQVRRRTGPDEQVAEQLAENPERARDLATKPIGEPPPYSQLSELTDLAAWSVVGNVMLNLDELLMKR